MPTRDDIFTAAPSPDPNTPFTYLSPETAISKNPVIDPNSTNNSGGLTPEQIENFKASSPGYGFGGLSVPVTDQELFDNQRYSKYSPLINNENVAGYQQSNWDKAFNGIAKGGVLATTTFLGSFATAYGLLKAGVTGDSSQIFNNEAQRLLHSINEASEDWLPNYYTNEEIEASALSPDNWFKANWFFDKFVKNIGFAVGAVYSGNLAAGLGMKAASSVAKWGFLSKNLPAISRLMSAGKNAEAAELMRNTLMRGKTAEQLTKFSDDLAKIARTENFYANAQDLTRRTLMSVYGVSGEAAFEALDAKENFKQGLIEDFKRKNAGAEPIGEDLDKIEKASNEVGLSAFKLNSLVLSASQFYQLPKLLGSSYKGTRAAANSVINNVDDVVFDSEKKMWINAPVSRFNKITKAVARPGAYVFQPSEAAEEFSQNMIQIGTQDYYNKKYKGESSDFMTSAIDSFLESISSKEGIESIMLGGLTGGLMQAKSTWSQRTDRSVNTSAFLSQLNKSASITDFMKASSEAAARGIALENDSEKAALAGDKLSFKDIEADKLINYLNPRIKFGRFDLVMEELKDLATLAAISDESFEILKTEGKAAETDTPLSFLNRLEKIEATAKSIKDIQENLYLRYSSVKNADGTNKYKSEVLDQMVYALAKVRDYDQRIPEVITEANKAGYNLQPIFDIINKNPDVKFDEVEAYKEILSNLEGKPLVSEEKAKIKESIDDSIELYHRRNKFIKEYDRLISDPKPFEEKEIKSEQAAGEKAKVKINTFTGEKDLEEGEEYYTLYVKNKPKDPSGTQFGIYSFTFLGENADGTIKIKLPNGDIKDISKEYFAKQSVANAKTAKDSYNFQFFRKHANKKMYRKIKGGKEIEGSLNINANGQLIFEYLGANGKIFSEVIDPKVAFTAQKGYKNPKFRFGDYKITSQDEALLAKGGGLNIEDVKDNTFDIIENLFEGSAERVKEIDGKIAAKKEQLSQKIKEYTELKETRERRGIRRGLKTPASIIASLNNTISVLEKEIEALEQDKQDAEVAQDYYLNLVDIVEEFDLKDELLLEELESEKRRLEELMQSQVKTISSLNSLIGNIKRLLKELTDFVSSILKKRSETPQSILDTLEFAREMGDFSDFPEIQEYISETEFIEEVKLDEVAKKEQLESLEKELKTVEKEFEDTKRQYEAHVEVYNTFKGILDQKRVQEEVKRKFEENKKLQQQFFGKIKEEGSKDGPPTGNDSEDAEAFTSSEGSAKKRLSVLFNSTSHPSVKYPEQDTRSERVKRFERFTNKYDKFSAEVKSKLKTIPVTINNEESLGLKGLIASVANEPFKDNTAPLPESKWGDVDQGIIFWAVVMFDENQYFLINENGEKIASLVEAAQNGVDLNLIVGDKQTSTDLTYQKTGEARFVDKNSAASPEEYQAKAKEYRKTILSKNEIDTTDVRDFRVSRGIPDREIEEVDGVKKYEFNAPTTNLVTIAELSENPEMITVSTTEEVVVEGSTFKIPVGRPYLKTPTSIDYLHNRNFDEKEVEILFKLLKAFGNKMLNDNVLDVNLLRALKGYIYIRQPKEGKAAARNQLYFDFDKGVMIMGKNEIEISLDPKEMDANANAIKTFLKGVYNNVDNAKLRSKENFLEVLDVDVKTGEITKSRLWKNYALFLASDKFVDKDGNVSPRDSKPLLGSSIRKVNPNIEGDYVFKNRYLVIEDPNAPFFGKEKVNSTEGAPKTGTKNIIRNGKTQNVYIAKDGLQIKFTVGKDFESLSIVEDDAFKAKVKELSGNSGYQEAAAQHNMSPEDYSRSMIYSQLYDHIEKETTKRSESKQKEKPQEKKEEKPKPSGKQTYTTSSGNVLTFTYNPETENLQFEEDENLSKQLTKILADPNVQAAADELGVTPRAVALEHLTVSLINELKKPAEASAPQQSAPAQSEEAPSIKGVDTEEEELYKVVPNKPFNYEAITDKQWNEFRDWMKKNLPQIPFERVKSIIQTTSGGLAWGRLRQGLISVFEGAPGTVPYHEAFEAVWAYFMPDSERQALYSEFLNRKGTFVEAGTGKTIAYKDATFEQAKEQIADEFGEYNNSRKVPQKPKTGISKILKFFVDLFNFFKIFNSKPSLIEDAFKRINKGYYAKATPRATGFVEEYASFGRLTSSQVKEANDHMLALLFQQLFKNNESLFELDSKKTQGLMEATRKIMIEKHEFTETEVNFIQKNVMKMLQSFDITFDEETSEFLMERNERGQSDYARDSFRMNIHSSSGPLRMLFASIIQQDFVEEGPKKLTEVQVKKTTPKLSPQLKLYTLANRSQMFIQTLEAFKGLNTLEEMAEKITELAQTNPNFSTLAKRLKIDTTLGVIKYDTLNNNDWRLLSTFFHIFHKQKPTAEIEYENEDGSLYTNPADLNRVDNEILDSIVENIKAKSKVLVNENGKFVLNKGRIDAYKNSTAQNRGIEFLIDFGIPVSKELYASLSKDQKQVLDKAASSIATYVNVKVSELSKKSSSIGVPLSNIAKVLATINNPQATSVIYGSTDKAKQKYVQHNRISVFVNVFNKVKNLDQLRMMYPQLNKTFSENSDILKLGGKFFDKNGDRTSEEMFIGYFDGRVGQEKNVPVDALTYNDRLISEINQNLQGKYYVLVPADSATEWTLDLGHTFSYASFGSNIAWNHIYETFKKYLKTEIDTIITNDESTNPDEINKKGKGGKLRFFEDLLSDKTKQLIYSEIKKKDFSFENLYAAIKDQVNSDIKSFIESENQKVKNTLQSYGNLIAGDKTFSFPRLDQTFRSDNGLGENLTEAELDRILSFINANYVVANIEMHKLIFGDPAQYSDELKRIKTSMSPRGTLLNTSEFNTFNRSYYNKGKDENTFGYDAFNSTVKTVTVSEFEYISPLSLVEGFKKNFPKLYSAYSKAAKIADGSAWSTPLFARSYKLRSGDWTEKDQAFFEYDLALARQFFKNKLSAEEYPEKQQRYDEAIIKKGAPSKPQEVFKPIVSGVEVNGNQLVDKYSITPMYFSLVKDSPLGREMYFKMMKEKVDYIIVPSGRKVGVKGVHPMYLNGKLNTQKFNNSVEFDWMYLGKQVETGHHDKKQTRGSQATKLVHLDLFENGGSISESLTEELENNQNLLNALTNHGYDKLLKKLGITEEVDDEGNAFYKVPDKTKLAEFFESNFLKLAPDENLIKMFELKNGEFTIPFESTNSYQRIKNMLMAAVDDHLVSPKYNGGQKVQASAALLGDKNLKFYYKKGDSFVEATEKDFGKEKVFPVSEALKFYTIEQEEDGKITKVNAMEIMLPAWFKKLPGIPKGISDEELIKLVDKKVLEGIGFRIPTQAMGSIEAFVVKGFLDENMGNTIIVPADIVTKAGSDFDIDKLNTYLKNVYVDPKGKIKEIPFFGIGEEAKQQLKEFMFNNELESLIRVTNLDRKIASLDEMADKDDRLSDENIESSEQELLDEVYQQSLENAYFDSMKNLILHPDNFERLLSPNSNMGLDDMTHKFAEASPEEFGASKTSLLSREYMSKIRHFFIVGKKGVGIAAVNITGHAIAQKVGLFIDVNRVNNSESYSMKYIGDGKIKLPHNTVTINGEIYPSLGGRKDASGENFISDILSAFANGFVDIAKDPWITQMGVNLKTAGTWMLLTRLGVPKDHLVYFMNQPIIRELIKSLDTWDKSRPTSLKVEELNIIKGKFNAGQQTASNITLSDLKSAFEKKFIQGKELTAAENALQLLVLEEFMKYSSMANHLFSFTQATNFDTARFTDFITADRKNLLKVVEEEANIISSVNKVINETFLRDIVKTLNQSREALSSILVFEKEIFKEVLDEVRLPFLTKFLTEEERTKISNKITASFLDHILQTKGLDNKGLPLNNFIKDFTVKGETLEKLDFLKNHSDKNVKNNEFIKILDRFVKTSVNGGKFLKFRTKDNTPDYRNIIINSIQELLDHPDPIVVNYTKTIIMTGILQSGTFKTPVSFNDLIPVETYSEIVKPALNRAKVSSDLNLFHELGSFYRNNWNDSNIVPVAKPMTGIYGPYIPELNVPSFIRGLKIKGSPVRLASVLPTNFKRKIAGSDFFMTSQIRPGFNRSQINEMKNNGDYSFIEKMLFKRVKNPDGTPYTVAQGDYVKELYVQVNAWGDGFYQQEYYNSPKQSLLDNGVEKVEKEFTDEEIISAIEGLNQDEPNKYSNDDPFKCK